MWGLILTSGCVGAYLRTHQDNQRRQTARKFTPYSMQTYVRKTSRITSMGHVNYHFERAHREDAYQAEGIRREEPGARQHCCPSCHPSSRIEPRSVPGCVCCETHTTNLQNVPAKRLLMHMGQDRLARRGAQRHMPIAGPLIRY